MIIILFQLKRYQMSKRKKIEENKAEDAKWEEASLSTHEKSKLEAALSEMPLPPYDQEVTDDIVLKLAKNVCLKLKFKDLRWERFLLDPKKEKCKKFLRLQDYIYEALMRQGPGPETTAAQTTA